MSMFQKYYEIKCPTEQTINDSEIKAKSNYILMSNVMPVMSMEKAIHDVSYKPCKCTCGWRAELAESHVEHSKLFGCDLISSKYDLSYDENGDLIATPKVSNEIEKKPTKKKKSSKDGKFDICGCYGKDLKKCGCFYCMGYIKNVSLEDNWLATKLSVLIKDKDIAKDLGAIWSPIVKKWYVRANNPNYHELVNRF